jgi:CheY-like chemotaxis protein
MKEDWVVCGEAENGDAAIELVRTVKPDVVLLDYTMPVMNGLEAARVLRVLAPECAILMYTMFATPQLSEFGFRGWRSRRPLQRCEGDRCRHGGHRSGGVWQGCVIQRELLKVKQRPVRFQDHIYAQNAPVCRMLHMQYLVNEIALTYGNGAYIENVAGAPEWQRLLCPC